MLTKCWLIVHYSVMAGDSWYPPRMAVGDIMNPIPYDDVLMLLLYFTGYMQKTAYKLLNGALMKQKNT